MNLDTIYKEVAKDINVDEKDVKAVYQSIFQFIKGILPTLPLQEITDKQQLQSFKNSFNINGLCKLFINFYKLTKINKYKNGKY